MSSSTAPLSVSIAGPIGVGKTLFGSTLAKHRGVPFVIEPYAENPYLSDFYKDKPAHALACQLSFMQARIMHHLQVVNSEEHKNGMVQDRSIFEDSVFPEALRASGVMSERDYTLYRSFYDIFVEGHKTEVPDVIIFLDAPVETLLSRIHKRGRKMEDSVDAAYLESLTPHFDAYVKDMSKRTAVFRIDWSIQRDVKSIDAAVASVWKDVTEAHV